MATMHLDVVTVERIVLAEEVTMVVAPGIEGQLGILPNHAALITALAEGEVLIHRASGADTSLAIGGGFLEVSNNRVTILADTAERADEIDVERAEAARRRAERMLQEKRMDSQDFARAEAALRRSMVRLKVGQRRRLGGRGGSSPSSENGGG